MNRNRTFLLGFIIITLTALSGLYLYQSKEASGRLSLVVSTTTSLYDTRAM